MIMEVLVGPTYGMEVSAASPSPSPSPSYARDRNGVPPAPVQGKAVISSSSASASSSCLFMNGLEDVVGELHEETQNGSSESSIGSPGDSDDEQENDEVSSSKGEHELRRNSNLSLDSLDDSLPIKRGLSNHYSGKSKSFGNLAEASSVKDLEKVENPFNKRRRLLIANKRSKKFFYSRLNPKSMPLLPFINDNDEKTDDDEDGGGHNTEASYTDHRLQERLEVKDPTTTTTAWRQQNQSRLKICSKSMSCFALGDLIEEEDEED